MEPELSQSDKAARDKINGKSGLYLSEAKGVIELDRFKVTQDQKKVKEVISVKEKKKSAEQSALGNELDRLLGPDEFKVLGEDLAFVVAKHKLTRKPEICEKVFRYMYFVILGWNSV